MASDTNVQWIPRRRLGVHALLAVVALFVAGSARAGSLDDVPGYVDGEPFLELVSDDDVSVEISLSGPLLRAISRVDSDLHEMAAGLESIRAVILDLSSDEVQARARDAVRQAERRMLKQNWSRLARVREGDSDVKILVLNDDEKILGLVVMVIEDDQLVFANIAGTLDLAAIRAISESMDIPGLDAVDLPDE